MTGLFVFFITSAEAANISSCASDFSSCSLYEDGNVLALPGLAISGDAVIFDADNRVSDVFRIFNDVVDTGLGTGLGQTVELLSESLGNLPLPSNFSANAVGMFESTAVIVGGVNNGLTETDYIGNGTLYQLFSSEEPGEPTPEPGTASLMLVGLVVCGRWRLKRS